MRTLRIALFVVIVVPVIGCSSIRTQSDFDRNADFGSYTTFAWYQEPKRNEGPTEGPNRLVDDRIRRSIVQNLQAKGLTPTETNAADLLVRYYASLDSHMAYLTTGWGYGWGCGPYWAFGCGFWPGWSHVTVQTIHEGTVIIDILDRKQNQLVWRGVGTSSLGKKSHSDETIDRKMTRILESFPPT